MAPLVELVAGVFGFAVEVAANGTGSARWRIWVPTWLALGAGIVLCVILSSPLAGWLALVAMPLGGFVLGCAWQHLRKQAEASVSADEDGGPGRKQG